MHDSHLGRDRYDEIAGPADPAADLRLGVMHSPEPRVSTGSPRTATTCCSPATLTAGRSACPVSGPWSTNCGIDRERVSGLHRHPVAGPEPRPRAWLHVSAGLGTSPWAPVRFCCRPEATLLTLVPRIR